MYSEQGTEPPTAPWAPQHKWLPLLRVCVHGVCVFTAVCVHFGWVKMQSMNSEYGTP